MVRPLRDARVGVTTCGLINIGGRDFWTRFFTFLQNCETDFNWAFLTKLGMDVGITGAAFAMRRDLLDRIGGLQRFGGSLLEDMSLGNLLYREKFAIVLGPFVECHVDRFDRGKAINYIKRLAVASNIYSRCDLHPVLSWCWLLWLPAARAQSDGRDRSDFLAPGGAGRVQRAVDEPGAADDNLFIFDAGRSCSSPSDAVMTWQGIRCRSIQRRHRNHLRRRSRSCSAGRRSSMSAHPGVGLPLWSLAVRAALTRAKCGSKRVCRPSSGRRATAITRCHVMRRR
jgi:hypothetical protein